jgi:Tfp pilus assembly protein PilP
MRTLSLTVIGLLVTASIASAQAQPGSAPATQATAAPAAQAPAGQAPAAPAVQAEKLTAEQKAESAIEPQGFTYSPEGRRDPFVSLLRRGAETRSTGPRASGVAGLGVSEVSLRGTMVSQGAFVGILQGVDSKNYIVRVGDRLSDGTIRSISADSMVILQQVNDPLSLEKQREVRKLLRQTEEAK